MSSIPKDARKDVRKLLSYLAWIDLDDGSSLNDCTIVDISEAGARLRLATAADIPEYFRLRLNRNGDSTRQCQVVRRENLNIAVKFIRDAPAKKAG